MADIKISELEPTTDLEGLYTIGSDKNNLSKKVSLQFLKDAANYANEQGDYAKEVGDTVNGNVGVNDYPAFSASASYSAGDIVRYNGTLYQFTANHAASAWNGNDVKATSINAITSGKLTELESETNNSNARDVFSLLKNKNEVDTTYTSGYINSSGKVSASSYAKHSDFVKIESGVRYLIHSSTSDAWHIAYYSDANEDSFLTTQKFDIVSTNRPIDVLLSIPHDALYVRVSIAIYAFAKFIKYSQNDEFIDVEEVEKRTSELESKVENFGDINIKEIFSLSKDKEDVDTTYSNGYINSSGKVSASSYAKHSDFVKIEDGVKYCVRTATSDSWKFAYYSDANEDSFISAYSPGATNSEQSDIFLTPPVNAYYVRVTISGYGNPRFIRFSKSDKLIDVEEVEKRTSELESKVNGGGFEEYYVKKDGSGNFTGVHQALKALANNENPKRIYVDGGEYDVLEEMGGQSFLDSIPSDIDYTYWYQYSNFVPHNTEIIGMGEVVINFFPPDSTPTARKLVICPMAFRGSVKLQNITIYASNCRYAIHDETGTDSKYKYAVKEFYNVKAINYGGGYPNAYGAGHGAANVIKFENCLFKALNVPWYSHDNSPQDNSTIILSNCAFVADGETSVQFGTLNASVGRINVQMNNCFISSKIKLNDGTTLTNRYALTLVKSGEPIIESNSGNLNFEPLIVI